MKQAVLGVTEKRDGRANSERETQMKRLDRLTGEAKKLALFGVTRYLAACEKTYVHPEGCALREIINDALNGVSIAQENANNPCSDQRSGQTSAALMCMENAV